MCQGFSCLGYGVWFLGKMVKVWLLGVAVVGMGYLHHSKVHVRSKVHYFPLMKARLDEKRRTLFRSTCFGPWLDITIVDNDETLVQHMLQKQLKSDDKHYDLSLIYNVNGHLLHFGRCEFSLITGFRFGTPTLRRFRTGPFKFRDRVFPDKIALDVIFMGRELISVVADPLVRMVGSLETWNDFPWGEHIWRMLYDVILNVNSFERDAFHKGLNMNPKFQPSYSLRGFILPFKGYLHHSKVHVRSKVHYFPLMKASLDEKRRTLFRSTCFGPWLDITIVDNDETLVQHMLQKQLKSDDKHYDLSLIYSVNEHLLHFGRCEFNLITGFRFGTPTLHRFRTGPFKFRDRVFPDKIALEVIFMGRELISVVADPLVRMVGSLETWNDFPWGEHIWRMLYDVILNVNSFERDAFHKGLNMNPKFQPSYSLRGFILPFKSGRWWTKEPNVVPRAIAWTKKVPFEASELFGELFPELQSDDLDEGASESFRHSVKFFNWYVPRPTPVDEVGLVDEYFRKRSEARKKMLTEDAKEDAENRTNLRTVSIMERVESIQEMCGSLLNLPAEVQSLKGRVHKLEIVIHIMTRKRMAGETVQHVNKAEQKCSQDGKKGRVEFGANAESDLANEYCTDLNDNFLNLFDEYVVSDHHYPWQKSVGAEIQDVCPKVKEVYDEDVEQIMTRKWMAGETVQHVNKAEQKCSQDGKKGRVEFGANVESDLANEYCTDLNDNFLNLYDEYVVSDHHYPWQKSVGAEIQDVCPKVKEVYDEDVEQDKWVILDDCEKVDKHEAEICRLGAEEEKRFGGGGVMKLPHIKLGLNRSRPKKRQYKYVLRPQITEDPPKQVIPTLETLKSHKNIRDPFMIEMCRDVKPWEDGLKRRYNSIDTIIIDRDFEEFLNMIKEEVMRIEETMSRGAGKTHIGPGNRAKYRVDLKAEWMNEMKIDTERNLRNQSAAIKNLKTQIGQLAKKFQVEKHDVEFEECKVLSLSEENKETERNTGSEKKFCGVSYLRENNVAYGRIPSQLPDKEPNPGKFLLPCTIDNFDMFALADLGASVNMMSFSLFKKLNLINLKKKTSMVEMADMSRTTPKGTVFEKEITLENKKEKITFNHNGSLKSINTNLEEVCMIKEANIASTPTNVDLYTKPVLCDSDSCEDCNINHCEERVSYSKQAQNRHNRIMSRVVDERNPLLKNHYCNPIIMVSNGTEQAWPSCDPFRYICDGGDNGELDHDKRAHLEWTCFHGTKRRDIDFGDLSFQNWYKVRFGNTIINEHVIKGFQQDYDYYQSNLPFDEGKSDLPEKVYNARLCSAETGECSKNIPPEDSNQHLKINCTNPEKRPKGRDYLFNEWIAERFGTTHIDKKTRLKVFVEWMIDSYSDESDESREYDDPFERSFEKFKLEFEREVLQLLDEYELKIGMKGYMLQDIWEKCERTFKKGRKFWHEVELEAMEVQECQIEGQSYDPPDIQVETSKVRKYNMDGVGSFISIDKAIDKQLPVGRVNGEKFKILIREEMHTQLGALPAD
ncbi:phospholipase-like protein [Artemisia annua]|uniref:Phospholipase-like protein n=1 Tax=Artemisia annua TaxID=35608 RepID=A0A2U1L9Q6_ARTAN|nr:phospholipase-like protein [Artemisia annua]